MLGLEEARPDLDVEEAARIERPDPENLLWDARPNTPGVLCNTLTASQSNPLMASNHAMIGEALAEFGEDAFPIAFGHWAVGSVSGYWVRTLDDEGKVAPAFRKLHELAVRLHEVPLLDEDDFNERQHEDQISFIRDHVGSRVEAEEVWSVLFDMGVDMSDTDTSVYIRPQFLQEAIEQVHQAGVQ